MNELRVDIWSDIACPWCYVGKRRLEEALAAFGARDSVKLVWRSFELDPSAPRALPEGLSYAARLARKYGTTVQKAEGMIQNMTAVAAKEGLSMRFDRIRPGNTFDAHQLLHLASRHGLQNDLKERLFRAYFTEGEAIAEPEVLVRLAGEVGLDIEEARAALTTAAFAAEVRRDEALAREVGITGVPFFVVGERFAISGAQPAELLLRALEKASALGEEKRASAPTEGEACGPSGCG